MYTGCRGSKYPDHTFQRIDIVEEKTAILQSYPVVRDEGRCPYSFHTTKDMNRLFSGSYLRLNFRISVIQVAHLQSCRFILPHPLQVDFQEQDMGYSENKNTSRYKEGVGKGTAPGLDHL